MEGNDWGETLSRVSNFLMVRHESGGVVDLFKFLVFNDAQSGAKFLESGGFFEEQLMEDSGNNGGGGGVTADHRWVIVVSIIVRKIIKFFGKPMEWTGSLVEFILNLLSLNGNFLGLVSRFLHGNVVMPERGSETFISAIGHLDGRIDLFDVEAFSKDFEKTIKVGSRAVMDLCIMASKLAYENAKVVKNIVDLHWKMHLVDFYNCWNDYQKERSTQVFIACDKRADANLIIISFRGTEPFDADDWITDVDYSWYEIPGLGKVHMGFLEALGLGNREDTTTFEEHLLQENAGPSNMNGVKAHCGPNQSSSLDGPILEMRDTTAYYTIKSKLKDLLKEHKNAKFVVTGHSLGGALAILFPTVLVLQKEDELMQRLLGVYTYGQPRIGNRQLGRYMEAHLEHPESKYFRVVYCNDLVPRLPYDDKTFLYKHFGICLYYNSLYIEKNVEEEPNKNYFGVRYMIPAYVNSVWELFRSFVMGYMCGPGYRESWESTLLRLVGLAIPGLSAHSPVDYVNAMRLGRQHL